MALTQRFTNPLSCRPKSEGVSKKAKDALKRILIDSLEEIEQAES